MMQVSSQHCWQVGHSHCMSSSLPRGWVVSHRQCMGAPSGTLRSRRSIAWRCPARGNHVNGCDCGYRENPIATPTILYRLRLVCLVSLSSGVAHWRPQTGSPAPHKRWWVYPAGRGPVGAGSRPRPPLGLPCSATPPGWVRKYPGRHMWVAGRLSHDRYHGC